MLLTGVLVVSLLVVLALTLPAARPERLRPFAPHGWSAVAPAALVLVWMLTGWEAVTHLTGRFRAPGRDIPRSSAITLVVVALLFGGITLALVTVLGTDAAAGTAPVTALLALRLGPAAAVIAAALALLVTLGNTNTNAYVAGLAELGGEMGRTGEAPRWLAGRALSTARGRSLAVVTGQAVLSLAVVTAFGWSTEQLVLLTAASQVAVYSAGLLAALRLLRRCSFGWWAAAVSLPPILLLAVLSGRYLLAPAAIAGAVLLYRQITTTRGSRVRDWQDPLPGTSA